MVIGIVRDSDDYEEGFIDTDAAVRVGCKVISAAEQVKGAVPGAVAEWHFEIDDQRFKVAVTTAPPLEEKVQ